MKIITAIFSILVYTANAQSFQTITFEQFAWTIHLPADYKIIDSSTATLDLTNNQKKFNDENKEKVNFSNSINLIKAVKDKLTLFMVSYSVSPTINLENWQQKDSAYNSLVIKNLIKKVNTKVDTSGSYIQIDGIEFKKMQVSFALNSKITQQATHLSTFYRGHMMAIVFTYYNVESENEMENMLRDSKFAGKSSSDSQ